MAKREHAGVVQPLASSPGRLVSFQRLLCSSFFLTPDFRLGSAPVSIPPPAPKPYTTLLEHPGAARGAASATNSLQRVHHLAAAAVKVVYPEKASS